MSTTPVSLPANFSGTATPRNIPRKACATTIDVHLTTNLKSRELCWAGTGCNILEAITLPPDRIERLRQELGDKEFERLGGFVDEFQRACTALRYAKVPVVAAPHGVPVK